MEMKKRPLAMVESDAEPKRGCTDDDSDVEEFFALLKQIEATAKQFGGRRGFNIRHDILPSDDNKTAVKSKPAWRPSFELEDFCTSRNGNGTRDVRVKAEERNNKEGITLGNEDDNEKCVKQRPLSNEDATETLDLNLPSTSAGFQLFI